MGGMIGSMIETKPVKVSVERLRRDYEHCKSVEGSMIIRELVHEVSVSSWGFQITHILVLDSDVLERTRI